MKRLILAIMCLLLTACSTITIDQIDKDGSQCRASRTAFFMSAGSIQGEACGGTVGATGSRADIEAITAVVAAAVNASINAVGVP